MKIGSWIAILQYHKRNIYIICVLFGDVTFFEWIIWFSLIRNLIIFCMFCNYYISSSKGLKFLVLVSKIKLTIMKLTVWYPYKFCCSTFHGEGVTLKFLLCLNILVNFFASHFLLFVIITLFIFFFNLIQFGFV